jgi:hypothetical protein
VVVVLGSPSGKRKKKSKKGGDGKRGTCTRCFLTHAHADDADADAPTSASTSASTSNEAHDDDGDERIALAMQAAAYVMERALAQGATNVAGIEHDAAFHDAQHSPRTNTSDVSPTASPARAVSPTTITAGDDDLQNTPSKRKKKASTGMEKRKGKDGAALALPPLTKRIVGVRDGARVVCG